MKKEIIWLKTIIPEKTRWLKTAVFADEKYTLDQFMSIWLVWLIEHTFVKVIGDCEGYIILKPVPIKWVFDIDINYFDTLFKYDASGDTVWIDGLWAPGRYKDVIDILRATRRKFVAWEHDGKLRCLPIHDLRSEHLSPDQIRDSLVRSS